MFVGRGVGDGRVAVAGAGAPGVDVAVLVGDAVVVAVPVVAGGLAPVGVAVWANTGPAKSNSSKGQRHARRRL